MMVEAFQNWESCMPVGIAHSGHHADHAQARAATLAEALAAKQEASFASLLDAALESALLPRRRAAPPLTGLGPTPELEHFVELIIAGDLEQAREFAAQRLRRDDRQALLDELLAPAAILLGEMWDRDACDFMDVTIGVNFLERMVRHTANTLLPVRPGRAVLLLPAPGDQHGFGVSLVADGFARAGWHVTTGPGKARGPLCRLLSRQWFDVVGLSVTADRALAALPGCIHAMRRASRNPALFVLLGGHAAHSSPVALAAAGADCVATDLAAALAAAETFAIGAMMDSRQSFSGKCVDTA
jgi:methylmalonyl-CoA mutase cobalamin-binding subunit